MRRILEYGKYSVVTCSNCQCKYTFELIDIQLEGTKSSAHFTTADYATVAWSELSEGETLLIMSNGGSVNNAARQFALNCRQHIGQKMQIDTTEELGLSVDDNRYIATKDKWVYNKEVTSSTAPSYSVIIFDKKYTGSVQTNGYGVAIVLDKCKKIIKVYDGANVGYWTGVKKVECPCCKNKDNVPVQS